MSSRPDTFKFISNNKKQIHGRRFRVYRVEKE